MRSEHGTFHAIETCRERLKRFVGYRLDRRLSARVDASDIVQETFFDASRHMGEFSNLGDDEILRRLKRAAIGRAIDACRRHLAARRRSVLRERRLGARAESSSGARMMEVLAGDQSSVSGKVLRNEELDRVKMALDELLPADREVLVLRHLLQFDVGEIAELTNSSRTAVTTRHLRAIRRLRRLLDVRSKG